MMSGEEINIEYYLMGGLNEDELLIIKYINNIISCIAK